MALIRLGAPEDEYWEFLAEQAEVAIAQNHRRPYPLDLDEKGELVPGSLSPEFRAWCTEHQIEPAPFAMKAVTEEPGDVLMLAAVADPRSRSLLRRALESKNHHIVIYGAQGLARIGDTAAVPLVIEAGRRTPTAFHPFVGVALVFFDDPIAASEAERLLEPERLARAREAAKTAGPDAVFHTQ